MSNIVKECNNDEKDDGMVIKPLIVTRVIKLKVMIIKG